jgi:hypothetical protein
MMKDSNSRYPGNNLWGRRRGLVVVRRYEPVTPLPRPGPQGGRQGNVDRLPGELQTLSSAGASVGLDLR